MLDLQGRLRDAGAQEDDTECLDSPATTALRVTVRGAWCMVQKCSADKCFVEVSTCRCHFPRETETKDT